MTIFKGAMRLILALCIIPTLGWGSAQAQSDQSDWAAEKERMADLGRQFDTAWDLYLHFQEEADGGQPLEWEDVPDWSGIWSRAASPFFYDPDQTSMNSLPPSVKLKPEYEQELRERIARREAGHLFDPISVCGTPTGFPRWFTEPFLREFAVTPHQTWLFEEQLNEVRRVYTDGRDHWSEDVAFNTPNGDTIGFWDGDRLIAHTKYVKEGIIQRIQPWHSDQIEGVEIWQKVDDTTLRADVWIYDPVVLEEPWYTRQIYKKVPNEDTALRIAYWECAENPNNIIVPTEEGGSNFGDFTFTPEEGQ